MSYSRRAQLKNAKAEKELVWAFCAERLISVTGSHVYTHDAFMIYQGWLSENYDKQTKLSVISFGRLIPKLWKRKSKVTKHDMGKILIGAQFV